MTLILILKLKSLFNIISYTGCLYFFINIQYKVNHKNQQKRILWNSTNKKSLESEEKAKIKLWPNFIPFGGWKFMSLKTGKIHDLSAANLDCMDRIESEGLFVC